MLLARTNYIRVLVYLKAIYGQKLKEIGFSTLSHVARYFLTVALTCFTKSFVIKNGISCLIERSPPIKTQLEHYHAQKGILTLTIKKRDNDIRI